MEVPIKVNGTRILRPSEYVSLRNELNPDQQIILDSLLLTGMRYEELVRFHGNPDWYDEKSGTIHLPAWAVKKGNGVKRPVQRERFVKLSIRGKGVIPNLFRIDIPGRVSFDQMIHRKALLALKNDNLDPIGICQKSMRKTLASWLRKYYPQALDEIFLSMGHSRITELRHYLGIPFSDKDKQEMKEWIEGWI